MKIVKTYSHMGGEEYLIVRNPDLYQEIKDIVSSLDASQHKTKISKEKTLLGKELYNPISLNKAFSKTFNSLGWVEKGCSYYITLDRELMEQTLSMSLKEQKRFLKRTTGMEPILSYIQTDFVKDKVAVEVQFDKYAFVAFDLFVKHMLFYSGGIIDIGVEILPMKSMQAQMSSGIAYFEGEVYNVMCQGRSSPPVPLLIIGIEP